MWPEMEMVSCKGASNLKTCDQIPCPKAPCRNREDDSADIERVGVKLDLTGHDNGGWYREPGFGLWTLEKRRSTMASPRLLRFDHESAVRARDLAVSSTATARVGNHAWNGEDAETMGNGD